MTTPWAATATGSSGPGLDLAECARALRVFIDPADACHFQAKPYWRTALAPGGDVEAQLVAVQRLDAGDSVYFGLNPVSLELKLGPSQKDVRKADVLRRRWFYVDLDRAKTEADLKLCATDAEREAVFLRARALWDFCADELEWPLPVQTDSGNGVGLFWRVDLPNDAASQQLLRDALRELARRFDSDAVGVDKSTHNSERVAKLPGSWSRKGPDTPERSHRMCRLVYVPEAVEVLTVEALRRLVPAKGAARPRPASVRPTDEHLHATAGEPDYGSHLDVEAGAKAAWSASASGGGDRSAYARAALERECGRMACTGPGNLNNQARDSAFSLATFIPLGLLTEQEVFTAVWNALKAAGGDDDRKDEDTIRRAIEAGKNAEPRRLPERNGPAVNGAPLHPASPQPSASDRVKEGEEITYKASTVTPKKVDWLWPGRLPLGKLVTFAGPGGIGKTFVLCDIIARITAGLEWPFSGGECAPVGSVLFLSAEDDPEDTLVPRLIECGADLDRVRFLKNAVQDYFTLADLKTLNRALDEVGPECSLVVLDPPTSFLGGIDDHKNAELRALLSPLASLASRRRFCLTNNTHFNKTTGPGVDAVTRVMGSIAWTTAVRAAHAFARDPDDADRAIFVPMKMNLTWRRKGLAYRVLPLDDDRARVEWLGEVDTTADEAVGRGTKREKTACEWMIDLFRQKREWPSEDLFRAAKQANVSHNAVYAAKKLLGLPKARKVTHQNGDEEWIWWVPKDWPHLSRNGEADA